jgi:hypothetical protein
MAPSCARASARPCVFARSPSRRSIFVVVVAEAPSAAL